MIHIFYMNCYCRHPSNSIRANINVVIHIKFVRRRSLQFDYLLMRYDIFIVFRFRFLGDLHYDLMRKLASERQKMLTMEIRTVREIYVQIVLYQAKQNVEVRCSTWS